MGSEVKIQVPDELIANLVHAEIAKKLSAEPKFVEAVVASVLNEKPSTYSRDTTFSSMTKAMIKQVAKDVFNAWLKDNRQHIEDAFRMYLNRNNQKILNDLVTQLASSISSSYVNVNLRISDGD